MTGMTKALILLNTNLGAELEVQTKLKKIDGILGVHQVYGVYDIVVEVEASSPQNLKNIVLSKVRSLKGVRSSLTISEVAPA